MDGKQTQITGEAAQFECSQRHAKGNNEVGKGRDGRKVNQVSVRFAILHREKVIKGLKERDRKKKTIKKHVSLNVMAAFDSSGRRTSGASRSTVDRRFLVLTEGTGRRTSSTCCTAPVCGDFSLPTNIRSLSNSD